MKKISGFVIVFILAALIFGCASAETVSGVRKYTANGNTLYYQWTLDKTAGKLTIGMYTGSNPPSSTLWNTDDNKKYTREIYIEDGVGLIPPSAFSYNTYLQTVSLPRSIYEIGGQAFHGDTGLTAVTFRNYNSLYNPDMTIGDSAFAGCSSLHNFLIHNMWDVSNGMDFPDTVVSIGQSAFSGCKAMEVVNLPIGKMTEIPANAFNNCSELKVVFMGNGIRTIGNNAFNGCGKLWNLTLSTGVTSIGNSAFSGCSSLQGTVALPTGLTSLGAAAFKEAGTSSFVLDIPSSIAEIPPNTLSGFKGTVIIRNRTAAIPGTDQVSFVGVIKGYKGSTAEAWAVANNAKVDYIDAAAPTKAVGRMRNSGPTYMWRLDTEGTLTVWQGTSNAVWTSYETSTGWDEYIGEITKIELSDSVTATSVEQFKNHTHVTEVTVGSGLASVGIKTFSGCTGLTAISFPATTTTFSGYTFENCTALESCSMPGATTLGGGVFKGCSALREFQIPGGVATLASETFFGCSALETVVIPNSVTKVNDTVFSGCSALKAMLVPTTVTSFSLSGIPEGTVIWGGSGSTAVTAARNANHPYGIMDTWRGPDYTWTEDGQSVTAVRSLFTGGGVYSEETETVSVLPATVIPADCETAGEETFTTEEFHNTAFAAQTRRNVIPKLGHDWAWDEGEYGMDSGLNGYCIISCRRNPEHVRRYGMKSKTKISETPMTCTEPARITYKLTFMIEEIPDGTVEIENGTPPGHSWQTPYSYVWAEDCSTVTASRRCKNQGCSEVETETVEAAETITRKVTCTVDGSAHYTGTFTNPAFTTQTTIRGIPAPGHQLEYVPEVEPTCTEKGNYAGYICTVCGYKQDCQERSALGHREKSLRAVAPTCTEPGRYNASICERCGIVLSEGDELPATGHNWKTTTAWKDEFTKVTLTQICQNDKTHVQEETVNTMRLDQSWRSAPTQSSGGLFRICPEPPFSVVEGVSYMSFWNDMSTPSIGNMEKLVLPADIRVIESGAFENTAFQYVDIPSGCERIEAGAFRNCEKLLYVIIPSKTQVEDGAFDGCRYAYFTRK